MKYTYKDISRAYKDNVSVKDFVSDTEDNYCKICYILAHLNDWRKPLDSIITLPVRFFGRGHVKRAYLSESIHKSRFKMSLIYGHPAVIKIFIETNDKIIICRWSRDMRQTYLTEDFYFKVKAAFEG